MKLLKLEFENINSLAGHWVIDFTDPSYEVNHNLFVICGDTGTGKTSILDAITLAIYGKTPRQNTVYKGGSGNEVMTRDRGYCWSRVTYECSKGVFVSEWSQRKARDKASGNLQDAEGVIYRLNDEDNPVFKGKTSRNEELGKVNAELILLDYDQFCRSIMLAQGEFSKFLESNEHERAQILEKLNGTGKYREIAKKGDEHWTSAKAARDMAKEALMALGGTLSEEELKALNDEINEKNKLQKQIQGKIENLSRLITWCDIYDEKTQKLAEAKYYNERAEEQKEKFKPKIIILDNAIKASKCKTFYEKLDETRRNNKDTEEQLIKLEKNSVSLNEICKNALRAKDDCEKKYRDAENYISDNEGLWKEVRKLDVMLGEVLENFNQAEKRYGEKEKLVNECKVNISNLTEDINGLETDIKAVNAYVDNNQIDAGIEKILSGYSTLEQQYNDNKKSLIAIEEDLSAKEKKRIAVNNEIASLLDICKANKEYIDNNKADAELTSVIATTQEMVKKYKEVFEAVKIAKEDLEKKLSDEKQLNSELNDAEKRLEEINKEKLELFNDDALVVANLIQQHLKAGDACPVCGSKEHPACKNVSSDISIKNEGEFVGGVADKIRLLNESSRKVESDIKKINEKKSAKSQLISTIKTSIDNNTEILKDCEREINDAWKLWGYSVDINTCDSKLLMLRKKLKNYNDANSQYDYNSKILNEKKVELSGFEVQISGLNKNKEACKKSILDAYEQLLYLVKPFVHDFSEKIIGTVYVALEERSEKFKNSKEKLEGLNGVFQTKVGKLSNQKNNLEIYIKDMNSEKEAKEKAQNNCHELKNNRALIFGDKSVDKEEETAKNNRDLLKNKYEKASQVLRDAEKNKTECDTSYRNLSRLLNQEKEREEKQYSEFLETLAINGFMLEEDYHNSVLAEDEIEKLINLKNDINDKVTATKQSIDDAKKDLSKHKEIHPDIDGSTPLIKDGYIEQKNVLDEQKNECIARVSAINVILKDNEANAEKIKEYNERYDKARKEFDRWDIIHGWFGKKGGDEFSAFVQGLTFASLLKLANKQLHKMKERYSLKASGDLSFVIEDTNLCTTRSISNLSGGEKFLVSLSLALGIADFASRNVKIDCLFMDEGFGTLDNDMLESVMECLVSQQKQGKMLGIITHVDSVVNQIDQKIKLEVDTNGHSTISGPGVERKNI